MLQSIFVTDFRLPRNIEFEIKNDLMRIKGKPHTKSKIFSHFLSQLKSIFTDFSPFTILKQIITAKNIFPNMRKFASLNQPSDYDPHFFARFLDY